MSQVAEKCRWVRSSVFYNRFYKSLTRPHWFLFIVSLMDYVPIFCVLILSVRSLICVIFGTRHTALANYSYNQLTVNVSPNNVKISLWVCEKSSWIGRWCGSSIDYANKQRPFLPTSSRLPTTVGEVLILLWAFIWWDFFSVLLAIKLCFTKFILLNLFCCKLNWLKNGE